MDTVFRDEDEIKLGDITITALLTPGHTKGSTTYVMNVVEDGKTYTVVFPDGTSVNPGYRVARNPSYKGIEDDFRRTFRTLEGLKPDIWLAPHNECLRPRRQARAGGDRTASRRGSIRRVTGNGSPRRRRCSRPAEKERAAPSPVASRVRGDRR